MGIWISKNIYIWYNGRTGRTDMNKKKSETQKCVSESIYMYQSLYVSVSCPVYIVVCLMLFIYGRVSVRAYTCIKVCMLVCLVLYILSYVLCYLFMGVCQWEHIHVSKFVCLCVLSCIYCRMSYVISLCFKLIIIIVYILCMLMRATGSHWLFVILVKYIKNIIIYIMLITNEIVCIEH